MLAYAPHKKIVYSEIFRSPCVFDTKKEAQKVLDNIRESHPASLGWRELDGYVVKGSNGKWQAVHSHVKYA